MNKTDCLKLDFGYENVPSLLVSSIIDTCCNQKVQDTNLHSWRQLSLEVARARSAINSYLSTCNNKIHDADEATENLKPITEPPGVVKKDLPNPVFTVSERMQNGTEETISLTWGVPGFYPGVHPRIIHFEIFIQIPEDKRSDTLKEWHRLTGVKVLDKDMGITLSHVCKDVKYRLAIRACYDQSVFSKLSTIIVV